MSREIDERVVQMRFENGQFERGIQTSIHSMNSLKKSMNFDDAAKGFEKLDKSAKSVDMSRLGSAVDAVRVKFTLLDAFVWNMFDRITNRAINAGETLIKSLSTDQITAGWSKFADKTGAVQTIMSATAKQFQDTGVQMQYVEDQLDKLNWFTDETSYNFLEMVNNIGKFTSNNIALDTSVTAMQGIANWAAISGANANEASRAMYNLSQAISSGSLRLQDWMSIENANMGTAQFKETAIEMGILAGTLVKRGNEIVSANGKTIVSVENFRETLSEKWLTGDVLLRTLDKYGAATNALNDIYAELEQSVTTSDIIEAIDDYSAALERARADSTKLGLSAEETAAKASEAGKTVAEEVAENWDISVERATELLRQFDDETMQFGLKAFKAAQEAKTFRDAIDSVKDAVSTGWMKTFELIFGNYLEAKELWTGVANELYDIFAESGNARNALLTIWKKDYGGTEYVRDMLLGMLKIIGALKTAISDGFGAGFGTMTPERLSQLTKSLHRFIRALVPSGETLARIHRIARGVGSALDILKTLVGGALSKSFKLLNVLLGDSNFSLLEFLAKIGDAVYGFRNWVHESTILNDAIDGLIDRIAAGKARIGEFYRAFLEIPLVQKAIQAFKTFGNALKTDFAGAIEHLRNGWKALMEDLNKAPKITSFEDLKNVVGKFYNYILKDLLNLEARFPITIKYIKAATKSIGDFFVGLGSHLGFLEGPFNGLLGVIKHLGDEVGKLFSGINAVDLAIIAFAATIAYTLAKVTSIFSTIFGAVEAVMNVLGGFAKSFKKWAKAKQIKEYAKAIMYLAVAIKLIADVDEAKAWNAVGVIIALGGALVILSVALDKLSSAEKKGGKGQKGFAMMALSILAIAGALYLLGVQGSDLVDRVAILSAIVIALAGIAVAVNKFAPSFQASATSIAAFSAGVLILVGALNKIGSLDTNTAARGVTGLMVIMLSLAAAMRIMSGGNAKLTNGGGDTVIKAAGSILAVAVAVRILIGAIKSISKMDPVDVVEGIIMIGAIMLEIGATMRIINKASGGSVKAGGSILALVLALNLVIPAIKGLAAIEGPTLARAEAAILAIGWIFIGAIASSKLGGPDAHKAGLMLIEMAAAITILVVAIRALGVMNTEILVKGTAAVSLLGLVMSTAIYASQNTKDVKASLYAIAAVIGILAYSVYQFAQIEWGTLISSAGSMSMLLIALGASMKLMSGIKVDKGSIAMLTIMGAMVGLFGYIIWRMNSLGDMSKAIQAGAGISLIMVSLGASMRIMSGTKGIDAAGMKTMWQLVAMVGVLGAAIAAIMKFAPEGDAKKALVIAGTIDILLPVLTGCFLALDKVKSAPNKSTMKKFSDMAIVMSAIGAAIFAISAIPGTDATKAAKIIVALDALVPVLVACMMGLSTMRKSPPKDVTKAFLAFSGIVAGLGALILYMSSFPESDMAKAIQIILGIDALLPVITACYVALAKFSGDKGVSTDALLAFGAFGVLIEGLGAILVGLVGFGDADMDKVIKMVVAIDLLMAVMTPCMLAIMNLGAYAHGFITTVVEIGLAIDVLGVLLAALVALFGLFPEDIMEKGARIGALIGETIGGLYNGIITGVGTAFIDLIPALGTALSEFMDNAQGFFDGLNNIDDGALKKAGLLTAVIIALIVADFMAAVETLASGFVNKINEALGFSNDLAGKMEHFGEAIAAFANACGDVDAEKVKGAAEAATLLVALEHVVPAQGGELQKFLGSKDLEKFGERLVSFGESLAGFVETVADVPPGAAANAAEAGKAMADLENALPPYGGELQNWFGEKDLEKFGQRLVSFGESLRDYVPLVEGITGDSVQGSANAGQILADLEKNLAPQGGSVANFLFGEQSLSTFGDNLDIFGKALRKYVLRTEDISGASVQGSAAAASALVDVQNKLAPSGGLSSLWSGDNSFKKFGANLVAFGEALNEYSETVSGIKFRSLNNVTSAVSAVVDLANEVATNTTWGEKLTNTVDQLITLMLREISSKADNIRYQFEQIVYWMSQGLQLGFNKYKKSMIDSAITLAKDIHDAFEKELEIASPSAVMAEDGKWIVEGIAEGINKTTSAEEAAAKKAQNIEAAFKSAFEGSSLFRNTMNLDLELWKVSEGYGADDSTIKGKEYEYGLKELDSLAKDAATYNAMLETARNTFAEGSKELIEAENQYKQALITMYKKKNELDAMVSSVTTDQRDIMKSFADNLKEASEFGAMLGWTQEQMEEYAGKQSGFDISGKKAFDQIIDDNREAFALLNKSNDELIAFAQEKSGYNMQTASQQISETTAIIGQALGQQEVSIRESTAAAVSRGVGNGIQQGLAQVDPYWQGEEKGLDLDLGLGTGIEDNKSFVIDKIVDLANSAIGEYDRRTKTFSPSRVMVERGEYFVQGLALGITRTTPESINATRSLATQTVDGLVNGLNAAAPRAYAVANQIAAQIKRTIQQALEIHSPSRFTTRMGEFFGLGLANGMRNQLSNVTDASESLAFGSLDALADAKSHIQAVLESDDSMMITPVLNMDELKRQAGRISGVLNTGNTLQIHSANIMAHNIAAQRSEGQNGSTTTPNGSIQTTYTFTQNNYSPKALSQADIYRQTRNQFSRLKGATKK